MSSKQNDIFEENVRDDMDALDLNEADVDWNEIYARGEDGGMSAVHTYLSELSADKSHEAEYSEGIDEASL